MKTKGRVTIPTDENFVEGTKKIAKLWGADAVRDCDGTVLPSNAAELAEKYIIRILLCAEITNGRESIRRKRIERF